MEKINDIDLKKWKEYKDIYTDSLWIIDKRDKSGVHTSEYWGNFIPQIPNQFMKRYTKKNDWVLDPFLGSGTTLIEAQRLERNSVGIELNPIIAKKAQKLIEIEGDALFSNKSIKAIVEVGDSTEIELELVMKKNNIKKFQLAILHPPYWDIIKFSDNKKDLSNTNYLNDFLIKMGDVIDNILPHLEKGRMITLVIGDKYQNSEWIPLGFYTMNEILKRKVILKSVIVKNFEETLGKRNQKSLWRYRALAGGYYIFKHEYIFLFQKKG